MSSPLEDECSNAQFEKILKAVNDLKSEIGMIKKILHVTDPSKRNDAQKPKKLGCRNKQQENKSETKNFLFIKFNVQDLLSNPKRESK